MSASYKTDIPTFYGRWFLNRLRAGFCKMVNPYNRRAIRVDLTRPAVDGFVFWTKNVHPFLSALEEVEQRGFPFVIQHTVNAYPRELESAVVEADRAFADLALIRQKYGPHVVVWRYDPILFTSLTPPEFHVENFGRLARNLRGVTDEVVVSFAHFYKKTLRNMNVAARSVGLSWRDPATEERQTFLLRLVAIAAAEGIRLTVCSQTASLVPGAGEARCVDARRLEAISGGRLRIELQGNRPECGCFASRDIGEYDTCPHGCIYCYAVQERRVAVERYRQHDPESEFLFAPPAGATEGSGEVSSLPLFDGPDTPTGPRS